MQKDFDGRPFDVLSVVLEGPRNAPVQVQARSLVPRMARSPGKIPPLRASARKGGRMPRRAAQFRRGDVRKEEKAQQKIIIIFSLRAFGKRHLEQAEGGSKTIRA